MRPYAEIWFPMAWPTGRNTRSMTSEAPKDGFLTVQEVATVWCRFIAFDDLAVAAYTLSRRDTVSRSPRSRVAGHSSTGKAFPESGMNEIISLDNVSIAFGPEVVYDRLSFSVIDGEFLCILGPSGCGKSTLLRVVSDLLGIDMGTVTVAGAPAAEVVAGTRLRLPVAAVSCRGAMRKKTSFSGSSFVSVANAPKPKCTKSARLLLELVGLGRDRHKSPAMPIRRRTPARFHRACARGRSAHRADGRAILLALDVQTRRRMRSEIIEIWKKTRQDHRFRHA